MEYNGIVYQTDPECAINFFFSKQLFFDKLIMK